MTGKRGNDGKGRGDGWVGSWVRKFRGVGMEWNKVAWGGRLACWIGVGVVGDRDAETS